MKLIDGDKLKARIDQLANEVEDPWLDALNSVFTKMIDEMPAEDPAEIVRCKDCADWKIYCPGMRKDGTGFCSDGRRLNRYC